MSDNRVSGRSSRIALFVVALASAATLSGCYERVHHYGRGPYHGPPAYAVYGGPPVGVRYEFDTYREVYIIRDRPGLYFHGGRFYRFRDNHWEHGDRDSGPWRRAGDFDLPRGLRKDWKGSHRDGNDNDRRGDNDWDRRDSNRNGGGDWNDGNRSGTGGSGWNDGRDGDWRRDNDRFDPNPGKGPGQGDRNWGQNQPGPGAWQPQQDPGKPDSPYDPQRKGKPGPRVWDGPYDPNNPPPGIQGTPVPY